MAYFPIIQKNDRHVATAGHRQLPAFYMEDFSVLGFRVNDRHQAARVLDRHAYGLKRTDNCIEIEINELARVNDVLQLLNKNGLACEIADVAVGIYQG